MKDVKDYRKDELKYYVFANILIIMLLQDDFREFVFKVLKSLFSLNEYSSVEAIMNIAFTGIISAIAYIYIFILDAIVSAPWKNKICSLYNLWSIFPGETIFDYIRQGKIKDERFTNLEAQAKYAWVYQQLDNSDCFKRKQESNSIWHSIFVRHMERPTVFVTYRDCFLCRDLVISTAWLLIIFSFLRLIGWFKINIIVFGFLLFEFLLTDCLLHVKQARLVHNVIAVDIHQPQEEKPEQLKRGEHTVNLADLDKKLKDTGWYESVNKPGYNKKDLSIFLCVIVIINLALIVIWLFTAHADNQFMAHFAFASTVTSIILSVLAIFMSISGEMKTQNLRDSIEQEAEHIFRVTEELKTQTTKLSNQVEMVQSTTENIKFSLNTNPVIPPVATGNSGKINVTQFDKGQV